MYKLGIDVGGTNTDAVLVDENRTVVADIKYPTSADIYDGILGAMRTVLEVSGVDPKQIHQAMLGTTQCTNAIVERKNLAPIGILRIGAPATTGIRPMVDWAEDIQKIAVGSTIIGGGFEYDGKELAPFDAEAAKAFFEEMKAKGVKSIAISCVFSTVRNDHELEAAKLCREVMGEDVHVSISSEIGSMGLIEREQGSDDKRNIFCTISYKGLAVADKLCEATRSAIRPQEPLSRTTASRIRAYVDAMGSLNCDASELILLGIYVLDGDEHTISALVDALGLLQPTVSMSVAALEGDGYVQRIGDSRHGFHVGLTEKGGAAARDIVSRIGELVVRRRRRLKSE